MEAGSLSSLPKTLKKWKITWPVSSLPAVCKPRTAVHFVECHPEWEGLRNLLTLHFYLTLHQSTLAIRILLRGAISISVKVSHVHTHGYQIQRAWQVRKEGSFIKVVVEPAQRQEIRLVLGLFLQEVSWCCSELMKQRGLWELFLSGYPGHSSSFYHYCMSPKLPSSTD